MKSSCALFMATLLFLQSFVPAMEVSELFKLPFLFEHFSEHVEKNSNLTFIAFLKMHYANERHHGDDPQSHHELPLTNHQHRPQAELNYIAIIVPPPAAPLTLQVLRDVTYGIYKQTLSSVINTTVWQPPKLG